jgi:lipopolysaccharide export system protein LptC
MNGVMTASVAHPGTRAFTATGRVDGDRIFRAARRHSRRVRVLRIAIPVMVLAGLAAILGAVWLNPLRMITRIPADIAGLVISGTKITMQQPKLSGYTRDARPYEMTARTAAQDLTKPNLVELRDLHANVEMQDSTKVTISALNGLYDTKDEMLTLRDDIVLISSTGYEGRLSEAHVDIRKGVIVSDKPVEVKMLNGMLNANRLEVTESGDLARFHGGVNMVMNVGTGGRPSQRAEAR